MGRGVSEPGDGGVRNDQVSHWQCFVGGSVDRRGRWNSFLTSGSQILGNNFSDCTFTIPLGSPEDFLSVGQVVTSVSEAALLGILGGKCSILSSPLPSFGNGLTIQAWKALISLGGCITCLSGLRKFYGCMKAL
jgi:hypothetical protein